MMIRAYLRASTMDQDADRAREVLQDFVRSRGLSVAAWYTENASGRSTDREELNRLLEDAHEGDVLLVESVDRLTRLPAGDWSTLRRQIESQGIRVVSVDLPSTHAALTDQADQDEMTSRVLSAVNSMLLEVVAAQAAADYEQRRRRQMQGIEKAKRLGKYQGRPIDEDLHKKIREVRKAGFSIRKTADITGTSPTTVQRALQRGTVRVQINQPAKKTRGSGTVHDKTSKAS